MKGQQPRISMIAAIDQNRLMGKGGRIPWHMPKDLAYFMRTTSGHAVLMGRTTFEDFGKPLKDRVNIVLTRQEDWRAEGVIVEHEQDSAFDRLLREEHMLTVARLEGNVALDGETEAEAFIIGGAQLYKIYLPKAQRLYLTEIDHAFEGDTYFPQFDRSLWREVSRKQHDPDDQNKYPYDFVVYDRL